MPSPVVGQIAAVSALALALGGGYWVTNHTPDREAAAATTTSQDMAFIQPQVRNPRAQLNGPAGGVFELVDAANKSRIVGISDNQPQAKYSVAITTANRNVTTLTERVRVSPPDAQGNVAISFRGTGRLQKLGRNTKNRMTSPTWPQFNPQGKIKLAGKPVHVELQGTMNTRNGSSSITGSVAGKPVQVNAPSPLTDTDVSLQQIVVESSSRNTPPATGNSEESVEDAAPKPSSTSGAPGSEPQPNGDDNFCSQLLNDNAAGQNAQEQQAEPTPGAAESGSPTVPSTPGDAAETPDQQLTANQESQKRQAREKRICAKLLGDTKPKKNKQPLHKKEKTASDSGSTKGVTETPVRKQLNGTAANEFEAANGVKVVLGKPRKVRMNGVGRATAIVPAQQLDANGKVVGYLEFALTYTNGTWQVSERYSISRPRS